MKDLPLSKVLPIMLETAEWSSDAEESLDEVHHQNNNNTAPTTTTTNNNNCTTTRTTSSSNSASTTASNSAPNTDRKCSTSSDDRSLVVVDHRRSSMPGGALLRRHFNHLKLRRKTSAPCVPPLPELTMSSNHSRKSTPTPPPQSAHAANHNHSNPFASMTGTPLIDLLEKLRPRQSSTTDSGVGSIPASVSSRAVGGGGSSSISSRRRSADVSTSSRTCSIASDFGCKKVSIEDEGYDHHAASTSLSTDDPFWKPLFVDTKLANAVGAGANGGLPGQGQGVGFGPATVPRRCMYYRQTSLIAGTGIGEARYQQQRVQRQRSNSEAGRYLLIRKCSDVTGAQELVGKLEAELAYCQILATMKCGDLMPALAKMVVLDCDLTIRKAFRALLDNNIGAAPIWDSRQHQFVGLLTVSDLIHILLSIDDDTSNSTAAAVRKGGVDLLSMMTTPRMAETKTGKRNDGFDEVLNSTTLRHRPRLKRALHHTAASPRRRRTVGLAENINYFVYAEESVAKAAKLLCDRRIHRLIVFDDLDRAGNALFLMSKKDILKALRIYIAKLPLPVCMERTIDDLMIGTWTDLITVTSQTTLDEALPLFIKHDGLSALPIVDDEYRVTDMMTKMDVMNFVIDVNRSDPVVVDSLLKKTVAEVISERIMDAEKLTTCSKKATLLLAVERLLYSDARRLVIVDCDGKLEAILAMADLMRFLTSGFL